MANIVLVLLHLALLLGDVCLSVPLSTDTLEDEDESNLEADIIDNYEIVPINEFKNGQRNLVSDPRLLWPDKIVYYELTHDQFSTGLQAKIHEALDDIMYHSCVRFELRRGQKTYLKLRNTGKGCSTRVGYHREQGALDLHIGGTSCHSRGTIQHEFLHALGFWHEHTRPDRGQHVSVIWSNVKPERKSNFIQRSSHETLNLGLPYDYASVMHYKNTAFSKNKKSPTLVPKVKEALKIMGQRRGVSTVDIAKLNRLYNCTGHYYRGDDVQSRNAVIAEINEPGVKIDFTQSETNDNEVFAHSRKEVQSPLSNSYYFKVTVKKGINCSTDVGSLDDGVLGITNGTAETVKLENEIIKIINVLKQDEIIRNNLNNNHSHKVKRETSNLRTEQSRNAELQDEQPSSGHQESFAPQKILPELLKGVLNNDNSDRPIVIQFAIYQPIVYKSNQSEPSKPNEDADQEQSSKVSSSFKQNIRDPEVSKPNYETTRRRKQDTHREDVVDKRMGDERYMVREPNFRGSQDDFIFPPRVSEEVGEDIVDAGRRFRQQSQVSRPNNKNWSGRSPVSNVQFSRQKPVIPERKDNVFISSKQEFAQSTRQENWEEGFINSHISHIQPARKRDEYTTTKRQQAEEDHFIENRKIVPNINLSQVSEMRGENIQDYVVKNNPITYSTQMSDDHHFEADDRYIPHSQASEIAESRLGSREKYDYQPHGDNDNRNIFNKDYMGNVRGLADVTSFKQKQSRRNIEKNGENENPSPTWNTGIDHELRNENLPKPDLRLFRERSSENRAHTEVYQSNEEIDAQDEQDGQKEENVNKKHDLVIKDDVNSDLDKDIRRKKLERSLLEDTDSKTPNNSRSENREMNTSRKGKSECIPRRRIQTRVRPALPKTSASLARRKQQT